MKRQKQILLVLLIVLAAALLYSYLSSPRLERVASEGTMSSSGNTSSPADDARSAVDPQKVNLELLESGREKYRGYKRDIFNYYRRPKPKPKPAPKPVAKVEPEPLPEPPPEPVITPRVRKQLARFTFLGFLEKDEELTIFLSKQDELFLVKKADFFGDENQFEVVDINDEKLTIRQAGASGLIEIVLKEEEPLIPSYSPGEDIGSTVNRTFRSGAPVTSPGGSVPPAERRRQWFKETQPSPAE